MKIDRITIEVEVPSGVVDPKMVVDTLKRAMDTFPFPHQAQGWSEPKTELSPNTHIGQVREWPPVHMANYLAQAAHAKQWLDNVTAQLLAEGYTENAAGELISPDGKTVVDCD